MNNSVCFSGYRPKKYNFTQENKKQIYQRLILEISACIKYGYNIYYFGAAPGLDLLAAYAVIYHKRAFDLKLICALPYENFYLSNEFDESWRKDYFAVIKKCDEIINISEQNYGSGNMFMVRNKFYDGKKGGTHNTINYAQQKGLRIINILPLQKLLCYNMSKASLNLSNGKPCLIKVSL